MTEMGQGARGSEAWLGSNWLPPPSGNNSVVVDPFGI